MKSTHLALSLTVIALVFTACKDEKTENANKNIDSYVVYVDSLETAGSDNVKTNWSAIEGRYNEKSMQAETALSDLKDNTAAKERVEMSKAKYASMQEKMKAEMEAAKPNPKQMMRNSLFGEGKVGDDMSFAWVNKDNIHDVYQQFVHTVENNKDKYSREDWDEIKLMYEALDSRKNTVEKEGLSSKDNLKIAGLKLKFAPMYTLNRMGAKSAEMEKAKK